MRNQNRSGDFGAYLDCIDRCWIRNIAAGLGFIEDGLHASTLKLCVQRRANLLQIMLLENTVSPSWGEITE